MLKFLKILIVLITAAISLPAQDLSNLKGQKPVTLYGNISLRGIFYYASGIPERMNPYNYVLSGASTLTLYGWSIPTSFSLTKQNHSFQQPFNQYGLSPTYKWITLHGGYRNVTFSPYTLAGHTILGGGFDINPGKFRAGLMYGRLNKATVIDTTSLSLVPYSFSRKGLAAKIGYGTPTSYFDLSYFQARDDSSSVTGELPKFDHRILPASNNVLAYGTKFTIAKRFFVESDGAVSLLTRDINSMVSLEARSNNETFRKYVGIFGANGSSEWAIAFNGGIGYRGKNFSIKTNYQRIEPGFTSMGAYFFNNDIENITVSPAYNHPSGKFRTNVSFGVEQDNVLKVKSATSRRVIAAGIISSQLTNRLGLDINFNNFSNNQTPNTLRFADSLKIIQTTQTLNIMPRYMIQQSDKIQIFLLSINISRMNDYNSYFNNNPMIPSRDIKMNQYMLNYSISYPQSRISINSSINFSNLKSAIVTNQYKGLTVGGNYALIGNRLNTGVNAGIIQGNNGENKNIILNGTLNIGYSINKWQSMRGMIYFTRNNPGSVVTGMNPAFTETRGELSYLMNFGYGYAKSK